MEQNLIPFNLDLLKMRVKLLLLKMAERMI